MRHSRVKHEGRALAQNFDTRHDLLGFEVTKEVAEIDMEEVPPSGDHNVIGVSVTNSKNKCGDAVS